MKRLPVMTIVLGALMLAFSLPFVLLCGALLGSMLGGGRGIHAVTGGFAFSVSNKRIAIWTFILAMAIFVFGIAPRLLRRRTAGTPGSGR